MASIFTFDPDPPRVSSPWATPPLEPRRANRDDATGTPLSRLRNQEMTADPADSTVDYSNITKLEAEPQEGPTEYKLHLLLRRRRSFLQTTTGRHISGSLRRAEAPSPVPISRSVSETNVLPNTPPTLSSTQSRHHRLEQLTTQLLWRLQQSCPCHISSSTAPLLPTLPDEAQLSAPEFPQRLLPGLEESKGALYEIGVADDGTFVGLAEDEMEESLNNLRAMAASLGCRVEVQRMVSVGDCEWVENPGTQQQNVRSSKLLVAEALVRPDQHLVDFSRIIRETESHGDAANNAGLLIESDLEPRHAVDQLRVSLTGATMSGKSSLLGSLSTATLDNGRGKSRLSLLKHRHEIASGMTSSVTQELIGYRDTIRPDGARVETQVIGYGSGDVTSWIDIHGSVETAEHGRLVFLSDSAGHPRFRRTALRGLVGWQPHWTLLCVPADNTEDSSGKIGASPTPQEILGPAAANLDLSQAYLQLCLSLELPLVVVITKYDLATRAGLRQTLANVLSALKEAGRKPCIVSDPSSSVTEADLHTLSADDLEYADSVVQGLKTSPLASVPIILTSAVKGTGINKLHAFLRELPIPIAVPPSPNCPSHLFYIEDVYSTNTRTDHSVIIGGHLRYGTLRIGDELVLGPYPMDTYPDDSDSGSGRQSSRNSPVPTSRSFPGALHKAHSRNTGIRPGNGSLGGYRYNEWRRVRIISLRNLRLPVRALYADQVGTIGIAPVGAPIASPSINRIRKGMVLATKEPKANRVITVSFAGTDAQAVRNLSVGSAVVVYVASVRASSKVVSVAAEATSTDDMSGDANGDDSKEEDEDAFGFGFGFDADEPHAAAAMEQSFSPSATTTIVTFQFIGPREFAELGATVLVSPGGGPGLSGSTERGAKGVAGLDGFVGKVVDGG